MRHRDDIRSDAGQFLPHGTGVVSRLKLLRGVFQRHVERDPLVLLRSLDGAIGRTVGRPFSRGLHGCRLRLAKRRRRVSEFDLRLCQEIAGEGRQNAAADRQHAGELAEFLDELAARRFAPQPSVNLGSKACLKITFLTVIHDANPPCVSCMGTSWFRPSSAYRNSKPASLRQISRGPSMTCIISAGWFPASHESALFTDKLARRLQVPKVS